MSEQRLNVGLKCFCACDCCVDAPKLRERAEKAELKVAELEVAIHSYMRKDIGNELINLRGRAEKAEARVRELEQAEREERQAAVGG